MVYHSGTGAGFRKLSHSDSRFRFLLLPLHKSDLLGNRNVTHFVAVQKDVTFLRKNDGRLIDWPPVEVALWLDTIGLSRTLSLHSPGETPTNVLS